MKESKAQKTVTVEEDKAEEEEEEQRRIPKREVEDIDKTSKTDKRIRLETNEDTINSKELTLETIQRDFDISLLQKRKQKQIRNRQYDVKAVAEGQTSRLLRMTTVLPEVDKFHDAEKYENTSTQIAWNDLTGMKLEAGKVKEARQKEMQYVKDKGVWTKIPRAVAQAKGWKIVKTRWIDINKGDDANPVYRSRLVGKEFNDGNMDGIFAGTPPLEALRYIVHEAATVDERKGKHNKVIMINDVARAFFEAKATRAVCVELPSESLSEEDKNKDMVGILNMSCTEHAMALLIGRKK